IRLAARSIGGYRQNCFAGLILLLAQVVFNTNGRFIWPSLFLFLCDANRSKYFLTANGQTLTRGIPSSGGVTPDHKGAMLPSWQHCKYVDEWCDGEIGGCNGDGTVLFGRLDRPCSRRG